MVGVEIGVVPLDHPSLNLCIIPMHCSQSGEYGGKWTSNSNWFVSLEILSRLVSGSSKLW